MARSHSPLTRRRPDPRAPEAGWWPFVCTVFLLWLGCYLVHVYQRTTEGIDGLSLWARAFGLDPVGAFGRFEFWRFLTYAALHENLPHLAADMLALAAFGRVLAAGVGATRVTAYALAGTLSGGIAAGIGALLSPERPVMGGTGLVCGVVGVYAVLHGSDTLFYLRNRIVPMWSLAALALLASLGASVAGGQWFNLLQVFGLAGGLVCFYLEPNLARWFILRRLERYHREVERDQQIVARVDELLAKVHEHGLDALTRRERTFLKQASRRYKERLEPSITPDGEESQP